ncbi:MAG: DUF3343 domain-containing protein [Bacteroidota bacterium]
MLYLFESTHLVINAEKRCMEKGMKYKIIPVPRNISHECSMAIEIADKHEKELDEILTSGDIKYSKYHKQYI